MSFNQLSNSEQRAFARLCVQRRVAHEAFWRHGQIADGKDILIVGDRPGPKAPQTDSYHHTPFYHKLYSGGWINAQLVKAGIEETRLFWINSATWDGKPTDDRVFHVKDWTHVIALGGLAWKFACDHARHDVTYTKFDHPQYWKRFHSREEYPLIPYLLQLLSKTQDDSKA